MEELKSISQTIELKKDKKYIFVLQKDALEVYRVNKLIDLLKKEGIKGIILVLEDVNKLKVFEKEA